MARAREIGLDYKSYASVRAASGHDVVAFLFSTNALRLRAPLPRLPVERAAKLAALRACGRLAVAQAPLSPEVVAAALGPVIDALHSAPRAHATFAQSGAALRAALGALPGSGVVLVGDTWAEAEWCSAARLAAYLPADLFFAQPVR